MRKLLTCIFAIMVSSPAVFAATGDYSRIVPSDNTNDNSSSTARVSGRQTSGKKAVEQTVASRTVSTDVSRTAGVASDGVRNTVSRVFTGAQSNVVERFGDSAVQTRGAISRSRGVSTEDAQAGLDAAVNTVGRNQRVKNASINSNSAVRRAGLVLRPSTAEVGGRATIGDTGIQTGSNIDEEIRRVQSRSLFGGKKVETTAESIAAAKDKLEQTATLNKSCQDQYNECMDQFCAVVDANQKRCSCSANLSKYIKSEQAVKDANAELNEVAQRIRYVGLSADEIRAIMEETEAEEALSTTKDTSENRSLLQQIEDMIRDPVSSNATYSESDSFGLDMDLDFSSDDGDLFSLDFLAGSGSSMANLRGEELYKAAKKRCNTVLKQCKEAGATSNQITGNYDLAIDKDCIAYEQGLTRMNETLLSNVRSANRMLQKARLAVLQNKNQYDAKGCIAALDACMTDDMVCGENYFKCVDPTKQYIDENGQVVLGQDISKILEFMKGYNNASITSDYLQNVYDTQTINEQDCTKASDDVGGTTAETSSGNKGACIVKYLLTKIGTKSRVTDEGLCRSVLEKCQYYTYDTNQSYKSFNDIVVNYIQRAMPNIRAAQQNIIYEYASTCMQDVAECYNQQISQVNSWTTNASAASISAIMRGACRNVALTCARAVFYNEADACMNSSGTPINCCTSSANTPELCCDTDTKCIENISKIFYQSLLCPTNSRYIFNGCSGERCVNSSCECNSGYSVFNNSSCMPSCEAHQKFDSVGNCVNKCATGYYNSTECVAECPTGTSADDAHNVCRQVQ